MWGTKTKEENLFLELQEWYKQQVDFDCIFKDYVPTINCYKLNNQDKMIVVLSHYILGLFYSDK